MSHNLTKTVGWFYPGLTKRDRILMQMKVRRWFAMPEWVAVHTQVICHSLMNKAHQFAPGRFQTPRVVYLASAPRVSSMYILHMASCVDMLLYTLTFIHATCHLGTAYCTGWEISLCFFCTERREEETWRDRKRDAQMITNMNFIFATERDPRCFSLPWQYFNITQSLNNLSPLWWQQTYRRVCKSALIPIKRINKYEEEAHKLQQDKEQILTEILPWSYTSDHGVPIDRGYH